MSLTAIPKDSASQAFRFRPGNEALDSSRPASDQAATKALPTVWVVGNDGQPHPVAVKLGASDDSGAELLDGPLKESQEVIVGVANAQNQSGLFWRSWWDFKMPPLIRTAEVSKHFPSGGTVIRAVS